VPAGADESLVGMTDELVMGATVPSNDNSDYYLDRAAIAHRFPYRSASRNNLPSKCRIPWKRWKKEPIRPVPVLTRFDVNPFSSKPFSSRSSEVIGAGRCSSWSRLTGPAFLPESVWFGRNAGFTSSLPKKNGRPHSRGGDRMKQHRGRSGGPCSRGGLFAEAVNRLAGRAHRRHVAEGDQHRGNQERAGH
jgi:hypothetical protein